MILSFEHIELSCKQEPVRLVLLVNNRYRILCNLSYSSTYDPSSHRLWFELIEVDRTSIAANVGNEPAGHSGNSSLIYGLIVVT